MTAPQKGDVFPQNVNFAYIPYTTEKAGINTCGIVTAYDASKEFMDKKIVLVSTPGAFTGTCSEKHLPGYIENVAKFKEKGVDKIVVIAYNDAYVMSAWGKAQGVQNDDIIFVSDTDTNFSKKLGWLKGERTARYALVIDHGKITYAEKEPARDITVSSAESVLAAL
ncbi:peroxisomal matrix protein [Xylariaceae sp. FL0255]|nr:peroxisomal matrix protein [Xylariaceae sp. FL0255]